MKRTFLLSSLVLALAATTRGQTAAPIGYTNDLLFSSPPSDVPVIEATNFVNNNFFEVVFQDLSLNAELFSTIGTRNYYNFGQLSFVPGMDFETYPVLSAGNYTAQPIPAAEVFNSGLIEVGTATNVFAVTSNGIVSLSAPKAIISATNIINPGVISLGYDGVISLSGQNLDLSRGSILMTNTGVSFTSLGDGIYEFFNSGGSGSVLAGYWGIGRSGFNPDDWFLFPPPISPPYIVTNRDGTVDFEQMALTNALPYEGGWIQGSNVFYHVAYVANTNTSYMPNVYVYPPDDPAYPNAVMVEWTQTVTNNDGTTYPLYLYATDMLPDYPAPTLYTNGYAGVGISRPTLIPTNYFVFETTFRISTPGDLIGSSAITQNFLAPSTNPAPTNVWTAYQALMPPTSVILADTAGQDVTNLPGRIELNGYGALDLSLSRLTAQNFIALNATNQFVGSAGAQISAPYSNLNLRNTNGVLAITNLLRPTVAQPCGYINLYSTYQTNLLAVYSNTTPLGFYTNMYHVLMVDAHVSPTVGALVGQAILRVTNTLEGDDNLVINDPLNITESYLFDASRITIATNAPGAANPCGSLTLENDSVIWPSVTPRLQYFTNNGVVQSFNGVFFGGDRSSPYYPTNAQEPYKAFVNTGTIANDGMFIWAQEFVNGGTMTASLGDVELDNAQNAILTNGLLSASGGLISLKADYLLVTSNLFTSTSLGLSATNAMSDNTTNLAAVPATLAGAWPTNGNTWVVGAGGINMAFKPASGDLLGTTITNFAPANGVVPIVWAGDDLGTNIVGYSNNAALGRLVLVGANANSTFSFSAPPGQAAAALYVDCLILGEATGSITNVDHNNNYLGLQTAPNMRVYFAQALDNQGVSIAEKLNGHNANGSGGFFWASNYNLGYYSSTNMLYPNGTTYYVNTALATSSDLDSSGSGILNFQNPAPVPVSWLSTNVNTVPLLASITNQPVSQLLVPLGQTAAFSVAATPTNLSYQWLYRPWNPTVLSNANGHVYYQVAVPNTAGAAVLADTYLLPIPGATGTSFTVTNVQWSDRGVYSVAVANAFGSVVSADAQLTIMAAPAITAPPANQVVLTNGVATFQVGAQGSLPLSYQWSINGTNLANATASSLTLAGVQTAQPLLNGSVLVTVSNAYGWASALASLNVLTIPVPTNAVQTPSGWLASATAISNNFPAVAGTYNGLFSDTNGVSAASSGSMSVQVTKSGGYTTKLALGGQTYSASGALNESKQIKRGNGLSPLTVFLQADPVTAGGLVFGQVSGSTSGTNWAAQAVACRADFTGANQAKTNRNYTLVFAPAANAATAPAGHGYGAVTLGTGGNIQFSGAMADGNKVGQNTTLSTNGYWPVFASLYSGGGLLIGWLQYSDFSGIASATTTIAPASAEGLLWVKTAKATGASPNYPAGFTNTVAVQGGLLAPTLGVALTGVQANDSFDLLLNGGGVTDDFSLKLGANNKFGAVPGLSLSFNNSSGLFTGSAVGSDQFKVSFQGVVLQNSTNGFGYFLGRGSITNSGSVVLSPAP